MSEWLAKYEPQLRLVYRLAVVAILGMCLAQLRSTQTGSELVDIRMNVEQMQRDLAAISVRVNPRQGDKVTVADPCVWPYTGERDECVKRRVDQAIAERKAAEILDAMKKNSGAR